MGAHYDRGRPFHHPRSLEHVRAMAGDAPIDRALDLACGTGMSTVALAGHAGSSSGVDVSPEMLRVGAARAGRALPARQRRDDCRSATRRSTRRRAARACTGSTSRASSPRCTACCGRARGSGCTTTTSSARWWACPSSPTWLRDALTRYPLPPRNPQVGDPSSLEPEGFEKIGDELFADDIDMTHGELTDYQLTISNFVAAAGAGNEPGRARGVGAANRPRRCSRASRPAPSASSAR